MAPADEAIQRLRDSRPPVTDAVTYLTIIEMSMSPDILPELQDILEDVELTSEIGWDLVEMLISVPGSEKCLETIARLGNPREVIVKVLEVMEQSTTAKSAEVEGEDQYDDNEEHTDQGQAASEKTQEQTCKQFITLCGMLEILHKRLQVKAPSRFLHTSLDTIAKAYDPSSAEATAAVISLAQSLSGQKRPPLPSRKSSIKLDTPFQETDPAKAAPDPEADDTDKVNANEPKILTRLLQAFITCIIEAYVNTNSMEWASRLLEYTYPERIVPGRKTMMQAFKEVDEFLTKDALIGQLVSVANDLALSKLPFIQTWEALQGSVSKNPLDVEFDPANIDSIKMSAGGFLCLTAYWVFASEVFDADHGHPDLFLLPDHHNILKAFLGDEPQAQITNNPGTVEALVVLAIWLESRNRVSGPTKEAADKDASFMSYHHLLTLVSVFHPGIRVRNAITRIAGLVLHADPDESDKLSILEDLFENCMFSSLQACAVTWLREEIIAAKKGALGSVFASAECFDTLQYSLFPSLTFLKEADTATLLQYWVQSAPFHLQAANFALFLYSGNDYKDLAPVGMAASIEHRYVGPLLHTAKVLSGAVDTKDAEGGEVGNDVLLELSILSDTLTRVPLQ